MSEVIRPNQAPIMTDAKQSPAPKEIRSGDLGCSLAEVMRVAAFLTASIDRGHGDSAARSAKATEPRSLAAPRTGGRLEASGALAQRARRGSGCLSQAT